MMDKRSLPILLIIYMLLFCAMTNSTMRTKRAKLKRPLHIIKDYIFTGMERTKRNEDGRLKRRSFGEDSEVAAQIRHLIFSNSMRKQRQRDHIDRVNQIQANKESL